jgi:carbonic anhydrase
LEKLVTKKSTFALLKKIHKNDSNNYEGACYMNINKNKKVLVITDVEQELVPILQKTTNIQPENMLTIESYGCIISHPYGDIMRSVIMAI